MIVPYLLAYCREAFGVCSKLNPYTGMDITCVYTSFYGFICDSVRLLHVTSDVIRTIVVRRRPNRMLTYVIT